MQVAVGAGDNDLLLQHAAQHGGHRWRLGVPHVGVADEHDISLEFGTGRVEKGRQARAGDLFLALEQHRHLDRQAADDGLPGAARLDEGQELALVVGGAAGNDVGLAIGLRHELRLERVGVPQTTRIDGLDVVMAVEQHMRPLPRAVVADHHRVARGRTHRGVKAEFAEFFLQPFGGALAVRGMRRIGRDRWNTDQVEQARKACVDIGVDIGEHLVEMRRGF